MADSQQSIFERDQWQCGVCGVAVARGAEVGHPLEPTLSVSVDQHEGRAVSITSHRICNRSSKVRDEYPPVLRETAQMTYQMLEGFTDLGGGRSGDENDCYPDEGYIEEWLAIWREMIRSADLWIALGFEVGVSSILRRVVCGLLRGEGELLGFVAVAPGY